MEQLDKRKLTKSEDFDEELNPFGFPEGKHVLNGRQALLRGDNIRLDCITKPGVLNNEGEPKEAVDGSADLKEPAIDSQLISLHPLIVKVGPQDALEEPLGGAGQEVGLDLFLHKGEHLAVLEELRLDLVGVVAGVKVA